MHREKLKLQIRTAPFFSFLHNLVVPIRMNSLLTSAQGKLGLFAGVFSSSMHDVCSVRSHGRDVDASVGALGAPASGFVSELG